MRLAGVAAIVSAGACLYGGEARGIMEAKVKAEVAAFHGKVGLFGKNLATGESFGIGAGERVTTASTIKLAVMVEAFAAVAEGKAKWTDALTLRDADKISGSGVLTEFDGGLSLTLRDAVHLMMVVSDNTATNLVIDHIGGDAVNRRMDSLGLKQTRLLRKVREDDKPAQGFTEAGRQASNEPFGLGVTTPREMVDLLEKIYRGEAVSKEASAEIITILKRQQDRRGIGRTLKNVEIANKSGALDQMRADAGIIYSARGPIAMAIYCTDLPEVDWTEDNPAYALISRISLILIDGLGR